MRLVLSLLWKFLSWQDIVYIEMGRLPLKQKEVHVNMCHESMLNVQQMWYKLPRHRWQHFCPIMPTPNSSFKKLTDDWNLNMLVLMSTSHYLN